MRKQFILDTTQAWIDAADQWNKSHAGSLRTLRDTLVPLMERL